MRLIKLSSLLMAAFMFSAIALEIAGQAQKTPGKGPVGNPFAGHWTYRSFRNNPEPVGDVDKDPSKLVKLLFAEAEWVVEDTKDGSFKGELRFDASSVMDLTGKITAAHAGAPARVHINGKGRPGTSTEKLFYDYDGVMAYHWPNGVDQRRAIVGTVIRVKPHDGAPAGYVASFIAVKHD